MSEFSYKTEEALQKLYSFGNLSEDRPTDETINKVERFLKNVDMYELPFHSITSGQNGAIVIEYKKGNKFAEVFISGVNELSLYTNNKLVYYGDVQPLKIITHFKI